MKIDEHDPEDLPFSTEYTDTESVLCKSFANIRDEIKLLLASGNYQEEFCYYIEVSEPDEHSAHNDKFVTPLISLCLLEAMGTYYLRYEVNQASKPWVDPSSLAALTRCVYRYTSVLDTAKDIEKYVEVHSYKWNSYERAFAMYRTGNQNYRPVKIEQTVKGA